MVRLAACFHPTQEVGAAVRLERIRGLTLRKPEGELFARFVGKVDGSVGHLGAGHALAMRSDESFECLALPTARPPTEHFDFTPDVEPLRSLGRRARIWRKLGASQGGRSDDQSSSDRASVHETFPSIRMLDPPPGSDPNSSRGCQQALGREATIPPGFAQRSAISLLM